MKKDWISIWGNAVSIAENRPEGYGKNITLRYPLRLQKLSFLSGISIIR